MITYNYIKCDRIKRTKKLWKQHNQSTVTQFERSQCVYRDRLKGQLRYCMWTTIITSSFGVIYLIESTITRFCELQ